MILLSIDEVIMLHDELLKTTGGTPGLRDRGLLESALLSMNAGFGGTEQYPTVEEKAARLAYALTANHAFVDGNKRIGILAMLVTLRLNDTELQYNQQELTDLGLGIADGSVGYKAVLRWINQHYREQ